MTAVEYRGWRIEECPDPPQSPYPHNHAIIPHEFDYDTAWRFALKHRLRYPTRNTPTKGEWPLMLEVGDEVLAVCH